jgi:hypothetical protein
MLGVSTPLKGGIIAMVHLYSPSSHPPSNVKPGTILSSSITNPITLGSCSYLIQLIYLFSNLTVTISHSTALFIIKIFINITKGIEKVIIGGSRSSVVAAIPLCTSATLLLCASTLL